MEQHTTSRAVNVWVMPRSLYRMIKRELPPLHAAGRVGRPAIAHRVVMNAIWFVLWTGCQWSTTAHDRLRQWQRHGVWLRAWKRLLRAYMRSRLTTAHRDGDVSFYCGRSRCRGPSLTITLESVCVLYESGAAVMAATVDGLWERVNEYSLHDRPPIRQIMPSSFEWSPIGDSLPRRDILCSILWRAHHWNVARHHGNTKNQYLLRKQSVDKEH